MTDQKDHILYIDDERENLIGFKYVFKNIYKTHIAQSAEESWEILNQFPVKVIISDQRMPKTTGTELLEKASEKFPNAYRIILTAYTDIHDIIEAINKGKIYQFIRKPWEKEEFKIVIDNAIKQYDLKQQNEVLLESLHLKNKELEEMNRSLEEIVKERTQKITEQNIELEKHRNNLEELIEERTKELEIAKNKAEESDNLKTSFLTNVSHEIRTPMNAIIGFIELLLSVNYDDNEKEEFKKNIYTNSETLLRLIDDILDLSRIEANQVTFEFEKINLQAFMYEMYRQFQNHQEMLNKTDINFILNIEDYPLEIMTDKVRLQQICSNLLSNAFKFTDEGKIEFCYKTVTKNNNDYLIFSVSDSGIGVPKESGNYIFDRFRKAEIDKNRLFRGAGLGLSISKRLVNMFDGEIWFNDNQPKGSCFQFEIPLISPEGESSKNKLQKKDTIYNFNGRVILVAEDEDSSFYYIEKLLQQNKASVIRAKNGKECVELFSKIKEIDLILMDLQMPIMNGYDAMNEIAKIDRTLPVIAQTAFAISNQEEQIQYHGFHDYIYKPFKPQDLLSLVEKYSHNGMGKA